MAALYRKYRPQTFAEVVGQGHVVQTLKNAIATKAPAHAYLFTGTRGVGKTTLARLFAKAVNCQHGKDGEACQACDICTAVTAGTFLDMVEIDAASNTGVENVRDLIEHIKFQPSQGAYKVFIIDEVHMLSKQAFNALLKTLEEPPAHVIFILATTEISKVPITIISRTQRFDFSALSSTEIGGHVTTVLTAEKQKLSDDVVALIAEQAAGSLRDALSLLDKVLSMGSALSDQDAYVLLGITDFATHIELLGTISTGDPAKIPQLYDEFAARGIDFTVLNKDFLEFLRKALIIKITGDAASGLSVEHYQQLKGLVDALTTAQVIHTIRLFLKAFKDAQSAPSPELPLLLASVEASLALSSRPLPSNMAPPSAPQVKAVTIEKTVMVEVEEVKPAPFVPEVETVMATVSVSESPTAEATIEEVQGFWPHVISKIKTINSPLATLVKNSPLIGVERGAIQLQVKYRFHKEHLESSKHYSLLTGIIEEVCGKKFGLQIVVKTDLEPQVTTAEALGNVLQVFGGELVE
jgi:DNA polymerase III subunit gamma/tau